MKYGFKIDFKIEYKLFIEWIFFQVIVNKF